jgi:tetratricopeptide (TPR) repeat protein
MTRQIRLVVATTVAVGCAVTGVVALATPGADHSAGASARSTTPATPTTVQDVLDRSIARTQDQVRRVPGDWPAWATLGLDYVQQARRTVDPTYYPKATAALRRSLQIHAAGNFPAMAGEAVLASAQHRFRAARAWARRGLRVDPQNAVLHGALADALTQLGRYDAAARAARQMELLRPGSDAEARLSYAAELRGRIRQATALMRLSRAHAGSPDDVAFADYYLAELARTSGRPAVALRLADEGLLAQPSSAMLREARARAEVALGRTDLARRDFAAAVARVPQPSYVLEYGELLQSLGMTGAANKQYALFRIEQKLFRANGVTLDSDATLFEADHGSAVTAVRLGRAAIRTRPFLDSYDAYGWALHRAGHDRAALVAVNRALSTGAHNALFRFHRGVILRTLGDRAAGDRDLALALRWDPSFNPLLAPVARRWLAHDRSTR